MRRFFAFAFVFLCGIFAAGTPALAAPAAVARPALWHVHGRNGQITFLGSLHLLPANMVWRTPEITNAITSSDVFVFETTDDAAAQAKIKALIDQQGTLPKGQSLRAMLTPKAQADFDMELQALNLPLSAVDDRRPWLASLLMEVTDMKQDGGALVAGPDFTIMSEASAAHKEMRYLETTEQQIAFIVPKDRAVELQEFEADLGEMRTEKGEYSQFVDAWATADTGKIDTLMNGSFTDLPGARAALLDDRNRAWIKRFEKMLDEHHTFFVTVGAGHMVGPKGVPALLRADGYAVEGP